MGRNVEEQVFLHGESKDMVEGEVRESLLASIPKSPNQNSKPSSMVLKKAHTVIPAHLFAEAISTLHGLDLRWSGPITPSEMQYVEQYVFAKYPEYCNGLVEEGDKIDLYSMCISEENQKYSPKSIVGTRESSSPSSSSSSSNLSDLDRTRLEPSRLLDILSKKFSFQGNFISIPEIQARNRALQHCGLSEDEYLVLFTPTLKEAMMMIGESYPFFRGNYYMTIIGEEHDFIREFVGYKDSKVVAAPETWLDLRIKGSQLSQYFRRKSKHCPKGLFAYPANVNGMRYSMHWISEAHRNSWHVLLDATGEEDRLTLALHRPDFVMCTVDNTHTQPSKITCLLARRNSFDITAPSA
uniref:Molybdenum cofactor sulfurase n=1 Tax=Davidia involucrata TaxID=16924 RepID=A0A5B7CAG2_DAVIN